jgi:hypothetical protein
VRLLTTIEKMANPAARIARARTGVYSSIALLLNVSPDQASVTVSVAL